MRTQPLDFSLSLSLSLSFSFFFLFYDDENEEGRRKIIKKYFLSTSTLFFLGGFSLPFSISRRPSGRWRWRRRRKRKDGHPLCPEGGPCFVIYIYFFHSNSTRFFFYKFNSTVTEFEFLRPTPTKKSNQKRKEQSAKNGSIYWNNTNSGTPQGGGMGVRGSTGGWNLLLEIFPTPPPQCLNVP